MLPGRAISAEYQTENSAFPWECALVIIRGFDSHRERQFRRAVEFGLSVKSERMSGFKSRPSRQMAGFPTRFCPSPLFDGSQDWVIAHNDVVAGSSPASGTTCRSSSVVEHVNSQFVSYPSVLSAGRRLWVLVDPAVAVQVRPEEQSEGV